MTSVIIRSISESYAQLACLAQSASLLSPNIIIGVAVAVVGNIRDAR